MKMTNADLLRWALAWLGYALMTSRAAPAVPVDDHQAVSATA